MSGFEYLDSLTGINGTFGYLVIVLLAMVGHAWSNHVPVSEPTTKLTSANQQNDDDEDDERDPPRNFTSKQLAHFDGTKDSNDEDKPVYLSLNGIVFDVSRGRNYYGPGGPYALFAGHEAGVALAKMSFDTEFLDTSCDTLNHGERMELENWIEKFTHYRCYPILGRWIPDNIMPNSDQILTKEDLAAHDGLQECPKGYATAPIYIGAGDKVFDVSFGGVTFYGPGCSYHRFAGRDASRALAKMSFEPEDTENTRISDLTEKQRKVMADWIKTFEGRKNYPIVGRLGKDKDEST